MKAANENVIVIQTGTGKAMTHQCSLPGFFARKRLGIKVRGIVKCKSCSKYWQWHEGGPGYAATHWRTIDIDKVGRL